MRHLSTTLGGHLLVRAVVAGLLFGSAVFAPTPSATATAAPPPTLPFPCGASKVFVVGDSLTVGAMSPGGLGKLLFWGGYTSRTDARVGRFISAGLYSLRFELSRKRLEPVVMVALGTNDVHAGYSAAALANRIDQVMAAVGPTRFVIWVNVQMGATTLADRFNTVLTAKALRYPNLTVADWNSTPNQQYFTKGGIHYTSTGYRNRAAFMFAALQRVTHCVGT